MSKRLLPFAAIAAFTAAGLHCSVSADIAGIENSVDHAIEAGVLADVDIKVSVKYDLSLESFDPSTGIFTPLTPPPTQRSFIAAAVGSKIVLVGGTDDNNDYSQAVDIYDTTTGQWSAGAPWTRVHDAYAATVGNLLCLVAGSYGLELHPIRTTDCYDITTNLWSERADVPDTQNNDDSVVVAGGKIYLIDYAHIGPSGAVIAGSGAMVYDPATDKWQSVPAPPVVRAYAGYVPVDNQLYQVGGADLGSLIDNTTPRAAGMAIFDVGTQEWTVGPDMPAGRGDGFGVDYVGDRLVVYLGLGERDNADTFKPGDTAWHAGQDQPTSFNPGIYTSVVHDGQLYLLDFADSISGGGTTASGKVWHYNPTTDAWTLAGQHAPDTRTPAYSAFSIGSNIYYVGTYTNVNVGVGKH